jgi:hypothetical protein
MALLFYLIFVAGFFSPQGTDRALIVIGVGGLAGLFTPQALEKLRQIADAVLTRPPDSTDSVRRAAGTPNLSAVDPPTGSVRGQTRVILHGSGFGAVERVMFGGKPATDAKAQGDTVMSAVTPDNPAGKVDVVVVFTNGMSTVLHSGFTYEALSVSALDPARGPAAGQQEVTVKGRGLMAGVQAVTFNGAAATIVEQPQAPWTTFKVHTPAHLAATVPVVVTLRDGQSVTLPNAYTYQ